MGDVQAGRKWFWTGLKIQEPIGRFAIHCALCKAWTSGASVSLTCKCTCACESCLSVLEFDDLLLGLVK